MSISGGSERVTLCFTSEFDKTDCFADIYLPTRSTMDPLPLVIAPHPVNWTAAEDYFGGIRQGLKKKHHAGYRGLADKYQVVIVMPHGHHRKTEHCSLAYEGQISDFAQLPDILEQNHISINRKKIYCCGLSMGGQESLVFSGRFSELVAATVVFNPIVDLAAWYEDIENSTMEEFKEFGTLINIQNEVGGTPSDNLEAYGPRSPIHYIEALSKVPLLVFWSEKDSVVPRQEEQHSYRLYKALKGINSAAPIAEFNHTAIHHYTHYSALECFMIHEWCDYDWAINWLLHFEHD